MHTVTTRVSDDTHHKLEIIAHKTDRTRGDILRKALEEYIEDMEDVDIAIQRLNANEKRIYLKAIQRKYALEN